MRSNMTKRQQAYRKGVIAEYLASVLLVLKGYRILGHRYRCPEGEIDLIARKGTAIIFVEVKNRKALEDALEAVSPSGRNRITRAARRYIATIPDTAERTYRFDVIAFSPPFNVRHIENAWFAPS